jgi:hypothetical protein
VDEHIDFEQKKFRVDATIAPLYEGVNAGNVVPGIGSLDQGLRDLVPLAPPPGGPPGPAPLIKVAKRGAVTGLTKGTVVDFFHDQKVSADPNSATFVAWEFSVKADAAASHEYHQEVELVPGQDTEKIKDKFKDEAVAVEIKQESGKQILRLSGHVFSLAGDSGACVGAAARRIVGLHHAGGRVEVQGIVNGQAQIVELPNGRGVAGYIRAVFHAMGLNEATGVVPPGTATAGAAMALDEARFEAPEAAALADLEKALVRTPAGQRLLLLWERFGEELAHLVHHRRRVLVVWHRAQGPGHAAAFMRALGTPDGRLSQDVAGVRLADFLRRLRDVLLREGDADLRRAIGDHGAFILALAERATSIPDLMKALAETDDPWSPS